MNIEGRNPVLELLRSDKEVNKLYIQHNINQDTKINAIVKKAKKRKINIVRKTKKELDRLSKTENHQGVIAISKQIQKMGLYDLINEKFESNEPVQLIYIREAFHEYNIGAIIRTAESAGFTAVILPPKINQTPQIARTSMGASNHIPIYSESLFSLIKNMKKLAIKVIGIERTENATPYTQADLSGDIILIIGGEDKSLSEEIISKCDETVIIPMKGKVNSLNMSTAAGIVIYETIRQNE